MLPEHARENLPAHCQGSFEDRIFLDSCHVRTRMAWQTATVYRFQCQQREKHGVARCLYKGRASRIQMHRLPLHRAPYKELADIENLPKKSRHAPIILQSTAPGPSARQRRQCDAGPKDQEGQAYGNDLGGSCDMKNRAHPIQADVLG